MILDIQVMHFDHCYHRVDRCTGILHKWGCRIAEFLPQMVVKALSRASPNDSGSLKLTCTLVNDVRPEKDWFVNRI